MDQTTEERRLAERRGPSRRGDDIKRMLLEDSLRELPAYFVSFVDDEKGVYTFYYATKLEAQKMLKALVEEGIDASRVAMYSRSDTRKAA